MKKNVRGSSKFRLPPGIAAATLVAVHFSSANADTPADAPATAPATAPPTMPATAPDSGPTGMPLKLGPFDFQPRIGTEFRYDDNILFTAANREADEIWVLRPGVQAVAGDKLSLLAIKDGGGDPLAVTPDSLVTETPDNWPGRFLILDESPLFQWYATHSHNDYIGNAGSFNILIPRTKSIFGATFSYDDEPITVVQANGLTGKQAIDAAVSGAYFVTDKTSLDDAVSFHREDYQIPSLSGYSEWKDTAWLNYQWTPLVNLSAGMNAGIDQIQDGLDADFEQLLLRARYNYAEKLNFNASAGGELREYNVSSVPTSLTPVFDLGCNYFLSARTSFNLEGNRDVSAAVVGDQIYTITSVILTANQGITDRLSTSLSGQYGYYQSESSAGGGDTTAGYYSIQASLSLKITRQIFGQLYYTHDSYASSGQAGVTDEIAGIRLSWRY